MTVPNQRILTVKKAKCDKWNLYTTNNLEAINEAARKLQSKGGFKLYFYLAKNQDNYNFALSSADFCEWSGMSRTAYTTAFQELLEKGFLVENGGNHFVFRDRTDLPEQKPKEQKAKNGFVF